MAQSDPIKWRILYYKFLFHGISKLVSKILWSSNILFFYMTIFVSTERILHSYSITLIKILP
jgi:hypothetical protein